MSTKYSLIMTSPDVPYKREDHDSLDLAKESFAKVKENPDLKGEIIYTLDGVQVDHWYYSVSAGRWRKLQG